MFLHRYQHFAKPRVVTQTYWPNYKFIPNLIYLNEINLNLIYLNEIHSKLNASYPTLSKSERTALKTIIEIPWNVQVEKINDWWDKDIHN